MGDSFVVKIVFSGEPPPTTASSPDMLRRATSIFSFSHLLTFWLCAGSVPCLEVEVAQAEEATAMLLPRHLSRLHCQSTSLQTIVTEEKKC